MPTPSFFETASSPRKRRPVAQNASFALAGLFLAMAAAGCTTHSQNWLEGPLEAQGPVPTDESTMSSAESVVDLAAAPEALESDAGVRPEELRFVVAKPEHIAPDPGAEPAAAPVTDAEPAADQDTAFPADSVLAEVNGEAITLQTVLEPVQADVNRWRKECPAEEFQRRCQAVAEVRARETVIHRLLLQEAKAQLPAEEQVRLKAAVVEAGDAAMSLMGGPDVAGPNADPVSKTVKMRAEEWVLVQGYLREKFASQVRVTQSDLLAAYRQAMAGRYVLPTKVRMGMIAIKKSDSATPAWAESVATAVQSRASHGEDFALLAQKYARDPAAPAGGDWGFIARGASRLPAVEEALFSLRVGQVGPVVETRDSFYIVKALDREDGRTVPFTEAQASLEQELRDKQYKRLVAGYLRDLYNQWSGQFKTANLATAPVAAADR
jgi:peptidyl-prolyl cis-trans isomerase C